MSNHEYNLISNDPDKPMDTPNSEQDSEPSAQAPNATSIQSPTEAITTKKAISPWRILAFVLLLCACGLGLNLIWLAISVPAMFNMNRQQTDKYSQDIEPLMARYQSASDRFDELDRDRNIDDPTWQTDMLKQLDEITAVSTEVKDYKPPFLYTAWQIGLVEMAGHYDRFADLYREGIDKKDESKMNTAKSELEIGESKRKQFEGTLELSKDFPFNIAPTKDDP